MSVELSTDAIDERGLIDSRYTCDSDNSSPELRWEQVPEGATSLAVIAEDPDAPGGLFTHWLIYNIPSQLKHLPAGIPPQDSLANGIRQGTNSFGKLGYAGPCPPHGDTPHRYIFRLYVLSFAPNLPPRCGRDEFLMAVRPFVIAECEVVGRYRRVVQRAG
jgi:Raf kinase inhibitor-like YbhB/YbcL family protein